MESKERQNSLISDNLTINTKKRRGKAITIYIYCVVYRQKLSIHKSKPKLIEIWEREEGQKESRKIQMVPPQGVLNTDTKPYADSAKIVTVGSVSDVQLGSIGTTTL